MDYSYHYVAFICVHLYLPEVRSLLDVYGICLYDNVSELFMAIDRETVNCERKLPTVSVESEFNDRP